VSTRPPTTSSPGSLRLPLEPALPAGVRTRLLADYDAFRSALPSNPQAYILDAYGIDIEGEYGGFPISVPFGKASGQLSLNVQQVRRDFEAGLGFVVLKTVIAQDEAGAQSMAAWAIPVTHMAVEPITGSDGEPGWTVTWKGRGWHESFERYCTFFADALDVAGESRASGPMPIAASVKYHLPGTGEPEFRVSEYRHTTRALEAVWSSRRSGPMLLEKDFSPTLAGDDRSREQECILRWLRDVPGLIRSSSDGAGVRLGMKLMNARFDLDFQVEMVRVLADESGGPGQFLTYANRLFDPEREFDGVRGVAYGGPDLSRRNLEALDLVNHARREGRIRNAVPPISATGDILSGRMAVEYGLRGATSCQMHTVFQLRDSEFGATTRNKTAAVLHHLLFHPESGLIVWLAHHSSIMGRTVSWRDLPEVDTALREASFETELR
jgi:hypothetical protein